MATSLQPTPMANAGPVEQFDAIVIGADFRHVSTDIAFANSALTCGS